MLLPMDAPKDQRPAPRPWWLRELRYLVRSALLAVPFALFFGVLQSNNWRSIWRVYEVAFVFSYVVGNCVRANQRWVIPHLGSRGPENDGKAVLVRHIGSYAITGILGTFAAAAIIHFTLVPDILSNWREVLVLLMFSLLFSALFIGIGFATYYYGAYLNRVREEERFKARVEHEVRTAAQIQQAMLPGKRTIGLAFEAAGASLPSRTIAGDFLDYFDLPGARLAFVLGDVSGKGPPAAILAAAIQGMFFSVSDSNETPAQAIRRVNGALVRRAVGSRFATVIHGLVTPEGSLVACNAGHNPPLLLRADGHSQWLTGGGGLLLGVFGEAQFEEEVLALSPGDTLVLFSDGVSEAENGTGEQFGEERILAALVSARQRPVEEMIERLLGEVRAFAGGEAQADDITILVVRYVGLGNRPDPAAETSSPALTS